MSHGDHEDHGDRGDHPFHIDAIVILPQHLHSVWTLPDGDADLDLD